MAVVGVWTGTAGALVTGPVAGPVAGPGPMALCTAAEAMVRIVGFVGGRPSRKEGREPGESQWAWVVAAGPQ